MRRVISGCYCFSATSALVLAACGGERPLATSPEIGSALADRTSNSALAAPSNAGAVATSPATIHVTWQDNSDNETRFELYRSITGATDTFALVAWVNADLQVLDDQALQPATQYCYKIRAVRMAGNKAFYSDFSNTACATTPTPPPPPPREACCTTALAVDSSTVRVSWSDQSSDEDDFRVYRSTNNGATWVVAGTTKDIVFVDSGVPNAEVGVCYQVVAFNTLGDAAPTNIACTNWPAAPTLVSVTALDEQTMDINWRDNSAIEDTYQVWAESSWGPICTSVACDAGGVYTVDWLVAELPANSTSYRCTGCAGAALWIAAKRGDAYASSDTWWP